MTWTLILTGPAKKDLRKLERDEQIRIASTLDQIAEQPFSGDHRIVRGFSGMHRRRVGDFRILFHANIEERIITIVSVQRRNETTYR